MRNDQNFSNESEEEEISFIVNYKGWVVVKRMVIDKNTTQQEIAQLLASIRSTIDRKSFDFTGINKEPIDSFVAKITEGKRATFSDLKNVLENLKSSEMNPVLDKACGDNPLLRDVAKEYLFTQILNSLGISAGLSLESLSKAYPELKIPKPRGRFKKE